MLALAPLLAVSGCSWFGGDDPAPVADASPAPVEQAEAPVEVIGADVEVGEPLTAPAVGQGVYFVSDLYELSGADLTEPALVRMVLDSALPADTPLAVAARDGEDGAWRFVDGQLDSDGTHVEFIVSRLATFGVLAVDADSITSRLGDAVDASLTDDAAAPEGVEAATCTDPEGAREDGYRAKSWKRTTLGWCLDRTGDERVLRVTNLRGVPVRVAAPGVGDLGTTGETAREDVAWEAWTAAVAAGSGDTPEGADTVLAPGQSVELDADLEPGTSLLVTGSDDARNRSVQVLHAAALALSEQVKAFGLVPADEVADGERVTERLLATAPCAAAIGGPTRALVKRCLGERALTDAFGDQALLLAPALRPRPTTRLLQSRMTTLETSAEQVEQRLEVMRDTADFGPLVGRFTGTGRSIVVGADGLVTESYGTAEGPVVTLGYELSDPDVGERAGSATATVTSVQVLDRRAARALGIPQVGQAGVLTLAPGGVLSAPFLSGTYCDATAAAKGRCTDPRSTPTAKPTAKPAAGGTKGSATGGTVTPARPTAAPTAAPTGSAETDR